MFGIGAPELIVILVVALLVFGPKRLPELARNLGRGLAEFRRASSDLRRSVDEAQEAVRLDAPVRESAPKPETGPPAQAGLRADEVPAPEAPDAKKPAAAEAPEPRGD